MSEDDNPVPPRKVPVERVVPDEQGETRSNNPVPPTPKPKPPPASEEKLVQSATRSHCLFDWSST